MKNSLNNRERLRILLNDAKLFLLLISTLAVFVELVRWRVSKNGDNNLKEGRKQEIGPGAGAH